MNGNPRTRPTASRLLAAAVLSLSVHAVVLLTLGAPRVEPSSEPEETVVVTRLETPEPAPLAVDAEEIAGESDEDSRSEESTSRPDLTKPAAVAVVVERPPRPEPRRPDEDRYNLRSVSQPDRHAPPPDEAEYLAEFDNSTDFQTMAEATTLFDEAPAPESGSAEDDRDDDAIDGGAEEALLSENDSADAEPLELVEDRAPESPDDRPEEQATARGVEDGADVEWVELEAGTANDLEVVPGDSDVDLPGDAEESMQANVQSAEGVGLASLRPTTAVAHAARVAASDGTLQSRGNPDGVDSDAYVEVFGGRDARETAQAERRARAASLAGDHDARWDRTRASLENFDVSVTPGSETNLNTRSDAIAGYIHYLHNKIHTRWWNYLAMLDLSFGPEDPLSDRSLITELEFAISRTGEVDAVNVVDGSGVLTFDAEAINLLYEIGPHRAPPPGLISSDGRAYVHWTFHRGNGGCGTFGASAHRIDSNEIEGG